MFLFTQVFAWPPIVSKKQLQFQRKFLSVRTRYYSIKKIDRGACLIFRWLNFGFGAAQNAKT